MSLYLFPTHVFFCVKAIGLQTFEIIFLHCLDFNSYNVLWNFSHCTIQLFCYRRNPWIKCDHSPVFSVSTPGCLDKCFPDTFKWCLDPHGIRVWEISIDEFLVFS
ncbi:hypothetical protein AMECASPLE_027024 [Ameca splendens]|uniref:Uncharacterized protein n=1 Tax=Ameca splendens TaxID=208324 RepID=A0ABV0YSI5_9TELE